MRRSSVFKAMAIATVMAVPFVVAEWCELRQTSAMEKTTEDKVDVNLDEQSATKIAEIVLVKVYGKAVLEERPWSVTNRKGVFGITGTLHYQKGGVATIEIDQANARIIWITHGK